MKNHLEKQPIKIIYLKILNLVGAMEAKIMGICDKERLVVYKLNSTGSFDRNNPIFENHWKAIYSDSVIGAKLKQLIGAEVVKGL